MKSINKIGFITCIVCTAIAALLSVLAIWNVVDATVVVWKALATLGVVFLASILTVTVNSTFGKNNEGGNNVASINVEVEK